RATGADGGYKSTHGPGGLFPDFRAGGAVVHEAVGGVVELVRPEPALFLPQAPGNMVVVARIRIRLLPHGQNFRTQRTQEVDFSSRLRFGNDDDGTVAASMADDREADAGVPGCSLDDRPPWLQQSSRLGVLDDAERGAVLHRTAGIHEFGLAEDFAAGQLRKAAQADERCVADVVIDPIVS